MELSQSRDAGNPSQENRPSSTGSSDTLRNRYSGGNFPSRLYSMLKQIEAEGRADIVSWQPHGRAFLVHKINEFEKEVLPR
jgi:hypothetical protein